MAAPRALDQIRGKCEEIAKVRSQEAPEQWLLLIYFPTECYSELQKYHKKYKDRAISVIGKEWATKVFLLTEGPGLTKSVDLTTLAIVDK